MRTQVIIIGAGPAGLLLARLLCRAEIACVVIERQSRAHVAGRIRAGVLERGTVEFLREIGVADRLDREGLIHDGFGLAVDGEMFRVDLRGPTGGAHVTVYGQTELTKDLTEAVIASGTPVIYEAGAVALHDIAGAAPSVTCVKDGESLRVEGEFIVGCDGFHGASRAALPDDVRKTYERVYPFGWLGILADVPPCDSELIYSNHARGFALASMRSRTRSRYYIQCAIDEDPAEWPDERLWDELALRLGDTAAAAMTRGPAIEKSVAPLRSFVCEPMRHGNLFLAGDAAHIVPPTGAKGLNLAAADARRLGRAFEAWYRAGDSSGLDGYSAKALARVWKTVRFSWWLTGLTHRFPTHDAFDRRMQIAELEYIRGSTAARAALAENYVGLALE